MRAPASGQTYESAHNGSHVRARKRAALREPRSADFVASAALLTRAFLQEQQQQHLQKERVRAILLPNSENEPQVQSSRFTAPAN